MSVSKEHSWSSYSAFCRNRLRKCNAWEGSNLASKTSLSDSESPAFPVSFLICQWEKMGLLTWNPHSLRVQCYVVFPSLRPFFIMAIRWACSSPSKPLYLCKYMACRCGQVGKHATNWRQYRPLIHSRWASGEGLFCICLSVLSVAVFGAFSALLKILLCFVLFHLWKHHIKRIWGSKYLYWSAVGSWNHGQLPSCDS